MPSPRRPAGFTIIDLLVVIMIVVMLLAVMAPALARVRSTSGVTTSLNNLSALGVAHQMYAADWNGRQATAIIDNFSTYSSSGITAMKNYFVVTGHAHPPLLLGYCNGTQWAYWMPGTPGQNGHASNWVAVTPFDFATRFGYFRIPNSEILNSYVAGRFYEETFYPPNDSMVYPLVAPLFDSPCGLTFPPGGGITTDQYWASYCTSPAATFNPAVFRAHSAGGFRDPFSLPNGFASPNLAQAMYPSLKTHMLEHHWNQNHPANVCNPLFPQGTYGGCEPYYFNMALASAPATLFYDGHVRLLPNAEVIAADAHILKQSNGVDGLWSRDTPLGVNGYFSEYGYDGTHVSHHILTTNGILGRDTLANMPASNLVNLP